MVGNSWARASCRKAGSGWGCRPGNSLCACFSRFQSYARTIQMARLLTESIPCNALCFFWTFAGNSCSATKRWHVTLDWKPRPVLAVDMEVAVISLQRYSPTPIYSSSEKEYGLPNRPLADSSCTQVGGVANEERSCWLNSSLQALRWAKLEFSAELSPTKLFSGFYFFNVLQLWPGLCHLCSALLAAGTGTRSLLGLSLSKCRTLVDCVDQLRASFFTASCHVWKQPQDYRNES